MNQTEIPKVEIHYNKIRTTEGSGQAHRQITVSDNGIGIDKQYHERIFKMFKQLHNRGEYEGSEISLAIVKLSVEKLGGTVKLKREEGKGTKFILQLTK